MGLIVALASFAYQEFAQGRRVTGAATLAAVAVLFLVYREADARTIEYFAGADAEELQPVLRRVGRAVRRRLPSR